MNHIRVIRLVFSIIFMMGMMLSVHAITDKTYKLSTVENDDDEMPTHVTRIWQDKKGFLWFSSWNGLFRYDGYDFVSFKMKPGNGIDILSDRVRKIVPGDEISGAQGNALFCLIEDKYFRFNLDSYTFENISEKENAALKQRDKVKNINNESRVVSCNGIVVPDVTLEYRDRQGITWMKNDLGIYKIVEGKSVYRTIGGTHGTVLSIYQVPGGDIFIASKDDNTVSVYTRELLFKGYLGQDGKLHATKIPFAHIYSMFSDSKGTIWLGAKPEGLFRMKQTSGTSYEISHISDNIPLTCKNIYDIKEDKQGRLWLATLGGGIAVITNPQASASEMKVQEINKIVKKAPIESQKVRRLLIMPDGKLIATTTAGIIALDNIYQNLNNIICYRHVREGKRASSLSNSATMDMVDCGDGRIAFSTESGGVNITAIKDLYSNECEFQHITKASGLETDIVKSMARLDDSNILLQQYDVLTIYNIKTNEVRSFRSSFFGSKMIFSEAKPLIMKNTGGTIMVVGLETGVISTTLHDLRQKIDSPELHLTQMTINGGQTIFNINNSDTIVLDSDQRDVVLRYAAMDLRDSHAISYITRIDETPWSKPSHVHGIGLHDLSAGEHHLRIRSTNALGQWTDNERVITIIVKPTFFEAWYGKALLILLLCAIVGGIVYIYLYIKAIDKHRKETLDSYLALLAEHERSAAAVAVTAEKDSEEAEAEQPTTTVKEVVTPRLSDEDNAFMQRLMTFVEEHMSDSSIGVQDIADAAATSRSSLNRKMHQLLGVTPADFLREARMKRACELLKTTTRSTSDIAFACGFSDPKYFSKQFKASTSMSPKEYRQEKNK